MKVFQIKYIISDQFFNLLEQISKENTHVQTLALGGIRNLLNYSILCPVSQGVKEKEEFWKKLKRLRFSSQEYSHFKQIVINKLLDLPNRMSFDSLELFNFTMNDIFELINNQNDYMTQDLDFNVDGRNNFSQSIKYLIENNSPLISSIHIIDNYLLNKEIYEKGNAIKDLVHTVNKLDLSASISKPEIKIRGRFTIEHLKKTKNKSDRQILNQNGIVCMCESTKFNNMSCEVQKLITNNPTPLTILVGGKDDFFFHGRYLTLVHQGKLMAKWYLEKGVNHLNEMPKKESDKKKYPTVIVRYPFNQIDDKLLTQGCIKHSNVN